MKPFVLAAAIAATLMATAATAQTTDWYVRGDAGATFDSRITSGGPRSDSGWSLDGGVGKSLGNGFRVEGQLLYQDNQGKHSSPDLKTFGGLVNGYYDFMPGAAWQPFVGAGVGVANVKADGDRGIHGDKTGFAYDVTAGVAHPFNDRLTGEVAYRYLGAPSVKFGSGPDRVNGDFSSSGITVGLRYTLGK